MKIAICDDNSIDLFNITSLIEEYKNINCDGITYSAFSNPIDFLDAVQKNDYDIVFLDILMPLINGIDVAKEIRKNDSKIIIVLLTSSTEFAIDGYSVKAYSYLLKPCTKECLFNLLNTLRQSLFQADEFVVIKTKSGIVKIFYSQIVYTEVSGKAVTFHLADKYSYTSYASLGEFEDMLLSRPEFCRTHRSYIINFHYVKEISARRILCINGENVPVSRRLYSEVKEKYIDNMFLENGV